MSNYLTASNLEHKLQALITNQEAVGVQIDLDHLRFCEDDLDKTIAELGNKVVPLLGLRVNVDERKCDTVFKDRGVTLNIGDYYYVKKIYLASGGYTSQVKSYWESSEHCPVGPYTRVSIEQVKLSQREKVGAQLLKLGWKPTMFSPTGKPKTTDKGEPCPNLKEVGNVGKELARWYILSHRRGAVKGIRDCLRPNGRVTARVNPQATNTSRSAHSKPIVNLPKADPSVIYGKEMRQLIVAAEGCELLGTDADALETMIMCHYLAKFKGGREDAAIFMDGDPHSAVADKFGITRGLAKTLNYSLMFGCSFKKVKENLNCTLKRAKEIHAEYWDMYPSLKKLREVCMSSHDNRGFVPGLDGRKIITRSSHSALNAVIQSAGSILIKQVLVLNYNKTKKEGHRSRQVAWIHDEWISEVHNSADKERVREIAIEAFAEASKILKLNYPITGDPVYGKNWADIH